MGWQPCGGCSGVECSTPCPGGVLPPDSAIFTGLAGTCVGLCGGETFLDPLALPLVDAGAGNSCYWLYVQTGTTCLGGVENQHIYRYRIEAGFMVLTIYFGIIDPTTILATYKISLASFDCSPGSSNTLTLDINTVPFCGPTFQPTITQTWP